MIQAPATLEMLLMDTNVYNMDENLNNFIHLHSQILRV